MYHSSGTFRNIALRTAHLQLTHVVVVVVDVKSEYNLWLSKQKLSYVLLKITHSLHTLTDGLNGQFEIAPVLEHLIWIPLG